MNEDSGKEENTPDPNLPVKWHNSPGRPTKAHTEEMMPILEQYFMEGLNNKQIAKLMGCSADAVANWRKKSVRPPHKAVARGDKAPIVRGSAEQDRTQAEILRMYAEGMTYLEIAKEIGLSYATVRARLMKAYKQYAEEQRDHLAGRQLADINVMKEKLLAMMMKPGAPSYGRRKKSEDGEIEPEQDNQSDGTEYLHLKDADAFTKLVDAMVRVMDREARLFGLDAANKVELSGTIKVDPEAIQLLAKIKEIRHEGSNDVVDAELVPDQIIPLMLGRSGYEPEEEDQED